MPQRLVAPHPPRISSVFSDSLLPVATLSSIRDQMLLPSSAAFLGPLVVRRLPLGLLATVAMTNY